MMLSKHLTALAAFAVTGAVALLANQTGPYHIHITGKTDKSIDGYGAAYHAGAAIEALVYVAGDASNASSEYYYEYISQDAETGAPRQPGYVVFELPVNSGTDSFQYVPEALMVEARYSWASNVAPAMFYPGYDNGAALYFYAGAGGNRSLYFQSFDDSCFGAAPPAQGYSPSVNVSNWHLCYQYVGGGYWYQTVSWVYSLPPHNPSCRPVNLALELA